MCSHAAALCAVILSALGVGSSGFASDFVAWSSPLDGLKKYLFQEEAARLTTTSDNTSVLHHDVAPWTKGRDGQPGKLGPSFGMPGATGC